MQYAWGEVSTTSQNATPQNFGMAERDGLGRTSKDDWQPQRGWSSVSTGSFPKRAPAPLTPRNTYAPAAENQAMGHKNVPEQKRLKDCIQAIEHGLKSSLGQRRNKTLTPYHSDAWAEELSKHGLSQKCYDFKRFR